MKRLASSAGRAVSTPSIIGSRPRTTEPGLRYAPPVPLRAIADLYWRSHDVRPQLRGEERQSPCASDALRCPDRSGRDGARSPQTRGVCAIHEIAAPRLNIAGP